MYLVRQVCNFLDCFFLFCQCLNIGNTFAVLCSQKPTMTPFYGRRSLCWTSIFQMPVPSEVKSPCDLEWTEIAKFGFHVLVVDPSTPFFPLAIFSIIHSLSSKFNFKEKEEKYLTWEIISSLILSPSSFHSASIFFLLFFICMVEKSFTICLNFLSQLDFWQLSFYSCPFWPLKCSFSTSSDICSHYALTYGWFLSSSKFLT